MPPETLPSGPNRRRRILIADDEPLVRSLVEYVATELGFEITVAKDGREATAQVERNSFDVVVTDVYMPNQDGLELIQFLRGANPPPKIIAISGGGKFGVNALRTAGLLGAAHVLPKPFEISRLVELLGKT